MIYSKIWNEESIRTDDERAEKKERNKRDREYFHVDVRESNKIISMRNKFYKSH